MEEEMIEILSLVGEIKSHFNFFDYVKLNIYDKENIFVVIAINLIPKHNEIVYEYNNKKHIVTDFITQYIVINKKYLNYKFFNINHIEFTNNNSIQKQDFVDSCLKSIKYCCYEKKVELSKKCETKLLKLNNYFLIPKCFIKNNNEIIMAIGLSYSDLRHTRFLIKEKI